MKFKILKKFLKSLILNNILFFYPSKSRHQVESFGNKIVNDNLISFENDIIFLKEEANSLFNEENFEKESSNISIMNNFYNSLTTQKEISKSNSIYAKNISEIINNNQGDKNLTLRLIQIEY